MVEYGGGIYGSGDDTIDVSMSENRHRSKSDHATGTLNPVNPILALLVMKVIVVTAINTREFKTNFRKIIINYPKILSSHHGGYHSHSNKICDKERELRIVSDIYFRKRSIVPAHLHIDVGCDDFVQIRKFMKVIKQHFTYNQASYHVIGCKKIKSKKWQTKR